MDVREKIQKDAKDAFLNSLNKKATIVSGTGSGKSKIALDIIQELDLSSVLLLTNSTTLRDTNWKDEFEKFGMLKFYESTVESATYQSAYKKGNWDYKRWDLIIYDEIDFILGGTEYIKCFEVLKCDRLLGLTGFVPEEKEEFLDKYAPVCFRMSTQELQEAKALNQTELIFVEYPLDTAMSIKVPKKAGGSFYTSENNQYVYYDTEFNRWLAIRSRLEAQLRLIPDSEIQKQSQAADWKFKISASKRKSILHNSDTSAKVVKELYKNIHSKPGNKLLIFSALTKQCDKLYNPFHGKNEDDFSGIEELNSGNINTLSVAKKINRGVNLVGVNYIIRESFDGSETDMQQIHGRGMRLSTDQVMKLIILIPYFKERVRQKDGSFKEEEFPTQAKNWAKKALDKFDTSNAKTIRLDKTLTLKESI